MLRLTMRGYFLAVAVLACASCDAVLGLGNFGFDGSAADASDECTGPNGCYACTPSTNEQYLNACGGGQCVAFDPTRVAPFLTADGGLPALPPLGDAAVDTGSTDASGTPDVGGE